MERVTPQEDHTWPHEDIDIPRPESRTRPQMSHPDYFVFVDGAYKSSSGGSGGVIMLDTLGEVVCAEGQYFGQKVKSNNEAEMEAMLEGLDLVESHIGRRA